MRARSSINLSHLDLKALTKILGVKKSQNKTELATAIRDKWVSQTALKEKLSVPSSLLSQPGNFRSDANTSFLYAIS